MKGRALYFIMSIIFLFTNISALKINEVELNPAGSDTGEEWIEIYSNSKEKISLENWKLKNNDGNEIILNESFSEYLVIELKTQWLDNSNEKIFLHDSTGKLIDETRLFSDSQNNNKTWQFCSEEWSFSESTKGEENNCEESDNENIEQQENKTEEDTDKQINLETENNFSNSSSNLIREDLTANKTKNIINLNSQIKTKNNEVIYKSKNQIIKEYAIYGFAIFLIIIIAVLLIKNN